MKTLAWKRQAETVIRSTLQELRPQLLAAWGNVEAQLKQDQSIVTELDILVEKRLRDALAGFDNSVGFGGEELGVNYEQKAFWIVDPIDGTEHFLRGIRGCVNQLALIENGRPTMSIIYDFVNDEWFTAIAGRGAFCNGKPLCVSSRPLERAWVSFDFANAATSTAGRAVLKRLQALPVKLVYTVEAGRFLAGGNIEGYIVLNGRGSPWDYAPRTLLAQEAGARLTHANGGPYNFRDPNFIVAAPQLYNALFGAVNPTTAQS